MRAPDRRVAIVTGGGAALEPDAAARLAEIGWDVALIGPEPGTFSSMLAIEADLADPASLRAAVTRVQSTLGPPGILLTSTETTSEAEALDAEERIRRTHAELRALFVCTQAVARPMVAKRWGRIIAVAHESEPGAARGQTLRAGLIAFIRSAALELGPFGVTANVIAPLRPAAPGSYPDGVAHLVEYLVSDRADGITGQSWYLPSVPAAASHVPESRSSRITFDRETVNRA
jgi:3-oxoacyl-[acyl-carrier protein] reductase